MGKGWITHCKYCKWIDVKMGYKLDPYEIRENGGDCLKYQMNEFSPNSPVYRSLVLVNSASSAQMSAICPARLPKQLSINEGHTMVKSMELMHTVHSPSTIHSHHTT